MREGCVCVCVFFSLNGQGNMMKYKNTSGVGEKIGEFEASVAWQRH